MLNPQTLEGVLTDYFDKQRKVFPCNTNRASDIGHPCLRYLVFNRTRWQDKLLPEIDLQIVFNEGNTQEEAVKKTLEGAGFVLTQQQRGYVEAPQKLTGHLDTFINHPVHIPVPIPAEIKGLSKWNWDSINSVDDMVNHKEWYIRKYPPQIMTYLYMTGKEEGLFILKNKGSGKIKFIPVSLDFEYMENILKKAESVNRYVDNNEIPPPIDETSICQRCDFRHICFKDASFGNGIIIVSDDLLMDKIVRMSQIEKVAEDFQELKEEVYEQIRERAKRDCGSDDKANIMIGDYMASCSKNKNGVWAVRSIGKI